VILVVVWNIVDVNENRVAVSDVTGTSEGQGAVRFFGGLSLCPFRTTVLNMGGLTGS
jgi:hypothetical protein